MAELMQPNIVGNFLQAYSTAQDRKREQEDALYNRQRQMRADERDEQKFNFDMDAGQLDMAYKRTAMLTEMLAQLPDNDPAAFEAGKQRATLPVEQGGLGLPLQQMAHLTVADLPRLKMQAGQTLKELQVKKAQADIAQSYAAAAASRRQGQSGGASGLFGQAAQRAALAGQVGIDVNTPAGQKYILTGQLPAAMTPTDKKAVQEADQMVLATGQGLAMLREARKLSDKSMAGFGMNSLSQVASLWGDKEAENTLYFDNLLQSQILPQLKAIFGGAPTEGERGILLELQGSSSLPYDVRNRIIDRAIRMAEERMNSYKATASELRAGTYYNPRQQAQLENAATPMPAAGATAAPPQFSGSGLLGQAGSSYTPYAQGQNRPAPASAATGKTKRGVSYTVLGD